MIERLEKYSKSKLIKAVGVGLLTACFSLPFFSPRTAPVSAEFGGIGAVPTYTDNAFYNPLGGFVASIGNVYQSNNVYLDTTIPTLYEGNNPYFQGGAFFIADYGQQWYTINPTRLDLNYQTYTPVSSFALRLVSPTVYDFDLLEQALAGAYVNFRGDFEIRHTVTAWSWLEERYVNVLDVTDLGSTYPLDIEVNGFDIRPDVIREIDGARYILLQEYTLTAIPFAFTQTYDVSVIMDMSNNPTYAEYTASVELFQPMPVYQGETGIFGFVDDFFNMEIFPNFRLYTMLIVALGITMFGLIMKLFLGG